MSEPALQAIVGFTLVTPDLNRLVQFYRDTLGFAVHGAENPINSSEIALLGLSGLGRRQRLSLGHQTLWINQYEQPGRPYPLGGDAASLWFQHLALVVADMHAAHERLSHIAPISQGGPQRLPDSSGGVLAFKFRDPDGHPLELLQFPAGKTPHTWQDRRRLDGQIGLGIDHSAISVADVDTSVAFYRQLGLDIGHRTRNEGVEQQRLDGLSGVEVAVVPMNPPGGTPHLELLSYRQPRGQAGPTLRPNDAAATRIVWHSEQARLISDPDGHLHQVCTKKNRK